MKIEDGVREALIGFSIVVIIGLLAYGGWMVKLWFNYAFGYESQVEESIQKLVKPECLKVTQ